MFRVYVDGQLINQTTDDTNTIFSPNLALEMGKAGSLEFSIPPTHFIYDHIKPLKTIVSVEDDGDEIFRGRILQPQRDFNNMRKIYCEGNLSYLVDSQQKGEKYEGTTHDLFRVIIDKHNRRVESEKQFEVGVIGIEDRSVIITGQSDQTEDPDTGEIDYKQIAINSMTDNWKSSYDYIENCLIDYCGGYLRTRKSDNITYIDLVNDYGYEVIPEIEFGVNLLDFLEETSIDDLFTVLIPLGDENLDISSVNGGSDELVDTEAVAIYGRIVKTHVFSNVNKPETLLENAQRFLANRYNIPNTITVKAIDLHIIDSSVPAIRVGMKVHVNSIPHWISDNMVCTRIEYDLDDPENNTYTFGNPHQTLTERYRKDKNKQSGGGGGGGIGGSAAGGAQAALDKFYDAWINLDPSTAHIDLGAVYNEFSDAKEVLKNQVGIDIDAVDGHVNIKALKTSYDELSDEVETWGSQINVNTEGIDLLTGQYTDLDGKYAAIKLRVEDNESKILLKADQTTIDGILKVTGNLSIGEGGRLDLNGGYYVTGFGRFQGGLSALTVKVDTELDVTGSANIGDLTAKSLTIGTSPYTPTKITSAEYGDINVLAHT